jgi:hypothetical protein
MARVGCCITARSGEHILCGNQNNTLTMKISHGHDFARVSVIAGLNLYHSQSFRFYFTSFLGRVSFKLDPKMRQLAKTCRPGQMTRPITAASRTRPPDRLSAPARRPRRRSRIEGSRISAEACAAPNREPVRPTCKQYHRHRKGQRVPARRR